MIFEMALLEKTVEGVIFLGSVLFGMKKIYDRIKNIDTNLKMCTIVSNATDGALSIIPIPNNRIRPHTHPD